MVSVQAFRLLKMVLYGLDITDIITIKGIWTDGEVGDLVDLYAEDFEFGDPLTPQMIAAFRVFWNHRYENLTFEGRGWEPLRFPLVDEEGDDIQEQLFEHNRSPAMTPLEKFGSLLLDEPPLSDAFNFQIFSALKFWHDWANQRRQTTEPNDWFERQKEIIRADLVIGDFLRSPVRLGDRIVQLTERLESVIPLVPTDNYNYLCQPVPRVPLNGFVFSLSEFLMENDMCIIDDVPLGLLDKLPHVSNECLANALVPIRDLEKDGWQRAKTPPSLLPPPADGTPRSPPPNLPPLLKPGVGLREPPADTGRR
jgi:hypothetical protein